MTTDSFATAASAPPRPLTADDITDSHVLSARLKANDLGWFRRFDAPTEEWRQILVAGLTEPPRPEGAEEAEWARDHLTAPEPTDAEVLAALNVSMDPHGPPEPHLGRYAPRDVDEMRRAIAAALSARAALSAARRDEEKR